MRLHPTTAETYHVRVRELTAELWDSDHGHALEAREAIRALVERIVLRPSTKDTCEF